MFFVPRACTTNWQHGTGLGGLPWSRWALLCITCSWHLQVY